MSHYIHVSEKTAADGNRLVLCVDGHEAWFIERPTDRQVGSSPLGGFRSEEAARRWADRSFAGGSWRPIRSPRSAENTDER